MPLTSTPITRYGVSFSAHSSPIAARITLYGPKQFQARLEFRRDGGSTTAYVDPDSNVTVYFVELALLGPILDTLRNEKPVGLAHGGTGNPPVLMAYLGVGDEPVGDEES